MSIRQHPVFDEEEKLHLRLATEIMHAARCELTDRIVESAIGFPSEGGKLVSTDVVVSTTDGTE